jgi:hypothetical protein
MSDPAAPKLEATPLFPRYRPLRACRLRLAMLLKPAAARGLAKVPDLPHLEGGNSPALRHPVASLLSEAAPVFRTRAPVDFWLGTNVTGGKKLMKKPRRNHGAAFKVRVALEAIRENSGTLERRLELSGVPMLGRRQKLGL